MRLYRFSPIETKEDLIETIHYIIYQTSKLSKKIINEELTITYLTVFSHYDEEYINLVKISEKLGILSNTNNGIKIKLYDPIKFGNQEIEYIRIRKPDPYRTQVGCNDFLVEDYLTFKQEYLRTNKGLRLIVRDDYEMIEFFDPDFDVFAYVSNKDFK